jgi:hypothetical protein
VDGERALDDFAPGTTTDDLALPAGTYSVAVFPADAADGSGTPVIGPVDLAVPASGNVSAIAHLGADGTPTITPFVNDTAAAADGQGRLVVRHTAAAPAVDVLAGGQPVFSGLTNPNEDSADLPAGTGQRLGGRSRHHGAGDRPCGRAGDRRPGDDRLRDRLPGGQHADVLVQTVPLGGGDAAPAGVPAGSGGLVDQGGVPAAVLLAGASASRRADRWHGAGPGPPPGLVHRPPRSARRRTRETRCPGARRRPPAGHRRPRRWLLLHGGDDVRRDGSAARCAAPAPPTAPAPPAPGAGAGAPPAAPVRSTASARLADVVDPRDPPVEVRFAGRARPLDAVGPGRRPPGRRAGGRPARRLVRPRTAAR